MNYKKKISLLSAFVLAWGSGLWAAEQIASGDAGGVADFAQDISAKAFDRSTGTFYVATDEANGDHTMVKAGPTDTTFSSLNAVGTAAEFVILDNYGTADNYFIPTPLLAFLQGTTTKKWLVGVQNSGTGAIVSVFDGTTAAARQIITADLKTGANTAVVAVTAIAGDHRLCTGTQKNSTSADAVGGLLGKAFVYGPTAIATPGANHDGVCSVNINLSTGAPITDAVPTAGLRQAIPLNAVENLTAAGGSLGVKGDGPGVQNTCGGWVNDLFWDEELQVLYAGASIRNAQNANGNTVNALVKGTLTATTGVLSVFSRADGTTALNGPAAVNPVTATVFAAKDNNNAYWANGAFSIVRKIRGMKTSTDKRYLILNATVGASAAGDLTALDIAVPTVYAVRINGDTTATDALRGNVVKNADGTALGNAWTAGDLGAIQVGAGPLPFDDSEFVTDMEIIGDTVYASVGNRDGVAAVAKTVAIDQGIWSSRAMFNQDGIIVGFTPWERVFTSVNIPSTDNAAFIAVDAQRGVVWQVNKVGDFQLAVKRTRWTQTTANDAGTALDERLNYDFDGDAVTAMLDLPTRTPGIGSVGGANESNSFALFGGNEQVVFAQTKSSNNNTVTTDFSLDTRYLKTDLPAGAGYVRALGFARLPVNAIGVAAGVNNFFFAGTDKGLYAFASPAGLGWNAAAGYGALNAAPFDTYTWQPMGTSFITGAVTAIEANGTSVFVVEQDITSKGAIVDKLHRFTIKGDIATMTLPANHSIIAQSGTDGIPANAIFTGFTIVSSSGVRADETYGILTTNAGVYTSNSELNATAAGAFAWYAIDLANIHALPFLSPVKRFPVAPLAQAANDGTAFGFTAGVLADAGNNNYWQQGAILNSGVDFVDSASVVFPYVNATSTPAGLNTTYLERISAFWTDGARRFFTTYDPNLTVGNTFKSMPYNTAEWNMTTGPVAINGFVDDTTTPWAINRINCMESISGLGVVVAGTSNGVVVLE